MEYTLVRTKDNLSKNGAYLATAYSVRDRLIEYWNDTNLKLKQVPAKRVYYMSIEYLLGRSLLNALTSLAVEDNYGVALKKLGFALEELYDEEQDAGIGNGGLGRLAACYLDSMATCNIPGWGYGLK
jgi:starch phosphorylase